MKLREAKCIFQEYINGLDDSILESKAVKDCNTNIGNATLVDASCITLLAKEDEICDKPTTDIAIGCRLPFKSLIMKMDYTTELNQNLEEGERVIFAYINETIVNPALVLPWKSGEPEFCLLSIFLIVKGRVVDIASFVPIDKQGNVQLPSGFNIMTAFSEKGNLYLQNKEYQQAIADSFLWVLYHLSVINCKGVRMVSNKVNLKPNASRQAREHFKGNEYYTIEVDGITKQYLKNNKKTDISLRYHRCRGHFKVVNNLFGSGIKGRYWWKPFMRGKKENGTIEKSYCFTNKEQV